MVIAVTSATMSAVTVTTDYGQGHRTVVRLTPEAEALLAKRLPSHMGSNTSSPAFRRQRPRPLLKASTAAFAEGNTATASRHANGVVIYAASWEDDGSTHSAAYSLPLEGPVEALTRISQGSITCNVNALWADGRMFTINESNFMGLYYYCDAYNPENSWWTDYSISWNANITPMASGAQDPSTGTTYGFFINDEFTSWCFAAIDTHTGAKTVLGNVDTPLYALAFDQKGQAYGLDADGGLYRVDKSSGERFKYADTGVATKYIPSATFDRSTGMLFYAVSNETSSSLYHINLTTGEAVKAYDFPDQEQVVGLYIPIEDNELKAATGLSINFPSNGLTGTLSFTAPSATVSGTPLEGNLSYSVYVDGSLSLTGTAAAGATVTTVKMTMPSSGTYNFTVICTGTDGAPGTPASLSAFVGADTPKAPANVKLTTFAAGSVFRISWDPVDTISVQGAAINPTYIAYDVIRYPEGETVASNLSFADRTAAHSYTESAVYPIEFTRIKYGVRARYRYSSQYESETGMSNVIVRGSVFPPYTWEFKDGSDESRSSQWDGITIVDANGDGNKWWKDPGFLPTTARANWVDMDDYLVFPKTTFKAGATYKVKLVYGASSYGMYRRISIKLSKGLDNASLANAPFMMEPFNTVSTETHNTREIYFTATEDGDFYPAFWDSTTGNNSYFYIKEFSISKPLDAEVPMAPEGLTVTPDAEGNLTATLRFQAPKRNIGDKPLTGLTRAAILRDGMQLADIPVTGAVTVYTDDKAAYGINNYTVTLYNDHGEGESASASAFIGFTLPADIERVDHKRTVDNPGSVTLSWTPVTRDANGLALPTVTYNVYGYSKNTPLLLAEGISETTYTDTPVRADSPQTFVYYAVTAVNDKGETNPLNGLTPFIAVGKPYDVPFTESWVDPTKQIWAVQETTGYAPSFLTVSDFTMEGYADPVPRSFDGDNAMLLFSGQYDGDTGLVISGKIHIPVNMEEPTLQFRYYTRPDNNATATIMIDKGLGMKPVEVTSFTGEAGWNTKTVNLDSYRGMDVQIGFRITKGGSFYYSLIDDIRVGKIYAHDLGKVSIEGPRKAFMDDDAVFYVTYSNTGTATASGYTIDLYRDGEKVATAAGEDLEPDTKASVKLTDHISTLLGRSGIYSAVVNYPGDAYMADNTTAEPLTVEFVAPVYPVATSLKGEKDDNEVDLEWGVPDLSDLPELTVTDDFETYESFALDDIGNWITVDEDDMPVRLPTYRQFPGIVEGETKTAFFVMDSDLPNVKGHSGYTAYSGKKYLLSLPRYDYGNVSDWLISPTLDGREQTISMYLYTDAYSPNVEILASSTGTALDDFTLVDTYTKRMQDWTLVEVTLPEGTRYFALHDHTSSPHMLFVDAITYLPDDPQLKLDIEGYNIYRDGVKVNAAPVTDTAWKDTAPVKDASYVVTVVYDKGESLPSNVAKLTDRVGIDNVNATAAHIMVVDNTIMIATARNTDTVSIVTTDGRMVWESAGPCNVAVSPGIYIVKAGTKTAKVIVR